MIHICLNKRISRRFRRLRAPNEKVVIVGEKLKLLFFSGRRKLEVYIFD